jgi:hypothetical protein
LFLEATEGDSAQTCGPMAAAHCFGRMRSGKVLAHWARLMVTIVLGYFFGQLHCDLRTATFRHLRSGIRIEVDRNSGSTPRLELVEGNDLPRPEMKSTLHSARIVPFTNRSWGSTSSLFGTSFEKVHLLSFWNYRRNFGNCRIEVSLSALGRRTEGELSPLNFPIWSLEVVPTCNAKPPHHGL